MHARPYIKSSHKVEMCSKYFAWSFITWVWYRYCTGTYLPRDCLTRTSSWAWHNSFETFVLFLLCLNCYHIRDKMHLKKVFLKNGQKRKKKKNVLTVTGTRYDLKYFKEIETCSRNHLPRNGSSFFSKNILKWQYRLFVDTGTGTYRITDGV